MALRNFCRWSAANSLAPVGLSQPRGERTRGGVINVRAPSHIRIDKSAVTETVIRPEVEPMVKFVIGISGLELCVASHLSMHR